MIEAKYRFSVLNSSPTRNYISEIKTHKFAFFKMSKWKITCNRFVAFIDIMGFKDMVLKMPHSKVYRMMREIEEARKFNATVNWRSSKIEYVQTTHYSDSIIIYSKDSSYNSLYAFINTISGMTEDLLVKKIPFKGAVAFGVMTLDTKKSIFFGQPLIDSYLLQEELHFYGVALHGTAEEQINLKHKSQIETFFLLRYLCPLKNGSSFHLTILPMCADASVQDKDDVTYFKKMIKALDSFRYRTSGHLRRYIDNTHSYLLYARETTGRK